jgi:predicted dehydrogenase
MQGGFLGRLFHFRGLYLHSGYIDPQRPISWRMQKNLAGGGALFDLGPHILDIMMYLVGMPTHICASTETFIRERPEAKDSKKTSRVDVDDAAAMLMSFKEGGLGYVEVSRFATGSEDDLRFEINGSQGAMSFNLMEPNWLHVFDNREKEPRGFRKLATVQKYPPPAVFPPPKSSIGWIRSHVASQYSFVNAIATGAETSPDFEDALRVHMIMDAAYRSASTGKWEDVVSSIAK